MQGRKILNAAEALQKIRGQGNGPVNAFATLLQAFEHQYLVRRFSCASVRRSRHAIILRVFVHEAGR
jgi:hypothetical protein